MVRAVLQRAVADINQLFVINSTLNEDGSPPFATQVTNTVAAPIAGHNLFANWGQVRTHFSD